MYRFKVEIVIDEEKVIKDDKYEPQVMYDYIRDMFKQFDLSEIKTGEQYHLVFTNKGGNKDLGAIGRIVFDLCDMDWFRKYATEFYWYELNNKKKIIEIANVFTFVSYHCWQAFVLAYRIQTAEIKSKKYFPIDMFLFLACEKKQSSI